MGESTAKPNHNRMERTAAVVCVVILTITIVRNRIVPNFLKKVMVQNNITKEAQKVVTDVARIEGPMVTIAYLVRPSLGITPLG